MLLWAANDIRYFLDMRLHFLTAFVATVLIGLVSGQFPLGNGFQSSSFASSGGGVQVSAGVNNFQSYNQAPPTNFNPNGRNGFTGTETQANSGEGVAINPVNPSNLFQQFPSPNIPVDPLSVPPVVAAASSSSFQQFPNVNVPVNPLRIPQINAAASSNSFQQFQSANAQGNLLRVSPVNSASANSFKLLPNANFPFNPFRVPPVNAEVSSNAFQPFPNANIPAGAVSSVNTAIHSNDFQHNPSPFVPDLPVNKPPVQPFSLMPSNKGQMGNGANYPPPQISNPSNAFSRAHSSASLSSGIPNDYPNFPFPKGFLDELIASLAAVKSSSTAEDASETVAASPKNLKNGNNKEMSKERNQNGNRRRNKKKSKARRKAESKSKVKANSKANRIQPATSKQDITTSASADDIIANITSSDIADRASEAFVTSSIAPITFKDLTTESKSKTSIPNIETSNVQDEDTKSRNTATSPTTQAILITNSEITNTDSEKTSESSVTKSTGKDGTRRITAANTGANILSTVSPKKPKVKAQKFKNKSKGKNKNKNRKTKLSTSHYETTQKSATKGSTPHSSSLQVAEVQRQTTNAVDTTTEATDATTTIAGAKANIMDSMVTKDFASSVASEHEEIKKVTDSSFESDVQTSKSEEIQNRSLDTQTNPTGSTSKVDEKMSSSTTTQSSEKKKSNKIGKRKNNSKKSNTSSRKRKTAQVQKTSAPKDDTSNLNFTKSDGYAPTPSGATSLSQSKTPSEKKYISSDLVNDYVTDATVQAFSTDFTNTDNDASKSEMIFNSAMSSTLKADPESDESKSDENSETSKSKSNSEISHKTTTGFENQGIPNDYPKFPFPKGFLNELLKCLEADSKSKSTEEATSEATPTVNESVNKENKKAKSKPRRKHGLKSKNSKRKSKADSKNIENAKSDVDSYSEGKVMTVSTTSPESKLDNSTNAVMDAGEMIAITTASNIVDSFSVTESSNVQKETTKSIVATIPTAQAVTTELDDIDSVTSKTKNPKSTEAGETKIITDESTGVRISSTESPKKTSVNAKKSKRKSKNKSKNKKNVKTKLSTNKYENTRKSTTKGFTSYSSSTQAEKSQGETTNSIDNETGDIDHTHTVESVTTSEMDFVLPNDKRSSTTKYQEEKRVADTSINKSDFITPKFEEKQMDSMVTESSKVSNKLSLSTAAPRKNKKRDRVSKSKNNRKRISTSGSKNTTPLQEQSNPLNDFKINKNPGEASEFIPTLSVTTLTTSSYKYTDKTTDKKNTPKSETSDVEAKSSLHTETAILKSEIGKSADASKSLTDSAISSKTTVGLQNQDSDLISDSVIKNNSKMLEMEIATTVEIENDDEEVSSKVSWKKHAGKSKTSKWKSKGKRKKKKRKELKSRKNKNEITKTKTDTTSPDIDIPTTKAQIVTIDSEHATAFATDQSFLSTSSGDFTFPRDPNLANSEKTSRQDETTTINFPFTDLNILSTNTSNKSNIKALSPRKKPKHKKRKLKRKPTKSKSEVIQTSLGLSKYSPSSSDSQMANIRSQAALSMDTITTINDQIILSTNSKTENNDSDLTGDFDTTTETIEDTTICKTKAVSDNLDIAPKKSSKRRRRPQHKKSRKSNSKRKLAFKYRLKQVASTDTPTKYSTSDDDKQTTHAEETVTYSVSKVKQNPTKVNTQSVYTTPMNNEPIGDDFTSDSDLETSPKSSETDESITKSLTINHNVSSTGFSKSLFRKFRKRKNKIKHKNGNSAFSMKKSVPPHQKMQFISSVDEATKQTGQSTLTAELSALSTTAKEAKNMRSSQTACEKTFSENKSKEWKKMVKKKHRRRKLPLRAKSKFAKTHSSSSTFSGSIRNPNDRISSTDSLPSKLDSTQEASSTQYLPVTITTREEVQTTTMIPIEKSAKTKGFKSKMVGKKNHHKRGNNIHKKFRRIHRVWKVKKKLPKRKNSRGNINQTASDIYSEDLDAVTTTRGFIGEADTFTPTLDITAETDEGSSDSSGETQNTPEDTVLSDYKITTDVNNISNSEDKFSTIVTEATADADETAKDNTEVTEMKTVNTTESEEISADKTMTTLKIKIAPVEIEISTTMETITTTGEEDNASETETSSDLDATTDEIETSITPNELVQSEEETTNKVITSKENTTTKKEIATSVNEITTILNEIPVTTTESSEREKKIIQSAEQTTVTKEEIATNQNAVTTSSDEALMSETVSSGTAKKTTEKITITTKKETTTPQIEEIMNKNKIAVTTNEPIKAETEIIKNAEETTEKESSTTKKTITSSQIEETVGENETFVTTTEQINAGEKINKTEVEETTATENEFTTSMNKVTTTENEPSITTNELTETGEKSTQIDEKSAGKENITKIENTTPVNEHSIEKESTMLLKKTTEIVDKDETAEYKGTEKATDKSTVVTHIESTETKGKVTKPINIIATTEPVTMAAPKSITKEEKTTVERESSTAKMEAVNEHTIAKESTILLKKTTEIVDKDETAEYKRTEKATDKSTVVTHIESTETKGKVTKPINIIATTEPVTMAAPKSITKEEKTTVERESSTAKMEAVNEHTIAKESTILLKKTTEIVDKDETAEYKRTEKATDKSTVVTHIESTETKGKVTKPINIIATTEPVTMAALKSITKEEKTTVERESSTAKMEAVNEHTIAKESTILLKKTTEIVDKDETAEYKRTEKATDKSTVVTHIESTETKGKVTKPINIIATTEPVTMAAPKSITKEEKTTVERESSTAKMEAVNEHTIAKESTILLKKTTEIVDKDETAEYKRTEKATDKSTVVTHIESTETKGKVTKPINIIATTEPVTMAAPKSITKEEKSTVERESSTAKMEADVTKEEITETPETESTLNTTYNYPFDYATETPPPGVECRKNERYYKCVPHCRHTCFNYDNYVVPCPTFCMPGCFCDPRFVVDENGDCVNISQCKNYTCGENEEWWDCKPQYHNTCANFARAEARLDFECESGCFCRDGLIQDNDGSCVEIYDCSDPICEETEESTDCLNTCNTCEADCHACTVTMCTPGCDCLDGYKRDANGTCIHASKCPVCTSPSPVSNSTE